MHHNWRIVDEPRGVGHEPSLKKTLPPSVSLTNPPLPLPHTAHRMLVSSPRANPTTSSPFAKPPSYPSMLGTDASVDLLAVAAATTGDEDGAVGGQQPRPPLLGGGSSGSLGDALPSSPFSCLGPPGLISVDSLWAAAAAAMDTGRAGSGGGLPPLPPPSLLAKRARSGSLGSSAELGGALAAATAVGIAAAGGAPPRTPAQPRKAGGGRPPPPARPQPPLLSPERLVAGWDALPTSLTLPGGGGTVITLLPSLWRAPLASGGGAVVTLAAKVGLPCSSAFATAAACETAGAEDTLCGVMFTLFHPRVVTTGVPGRPGAAELAAATAAAAACETAGAEDTLCGVMFTLFHPRVVTTGVPGRPGAAELAAATAAAAAAGDQQQQQPASPTLPALAAPASVFASCSRTTDPASHPGRVSVLEVVLVRRPPAGTAGPALDLWHLARPPPGDEIGALPGTPAWPGEWLIDVAARVGDGVGGSAWLRVAAPRRLPEQC